MTRRADGRGILRLSYRRGRKAGTREVDVDARGWTVVGYSRKKALAERAVIPATDPLMVSTYSGQALCFARRWLSSKVSRFETKRFFADGAP